MVLPAHATNKIKNEISIEHTYNSDAWLTHEQAIYAIVSYLPVSSFLSIIMSSKVKSFAHWKLSATLTKKKSLWHWPEWLGWPGNGGKTGKEYVKSSSLSISISLNQFALYFHVLTP